MLLVKRHNFEMIFKVILCVYMHRYRYRYRYFIYRYKKCYGYYFFFFFFSRHEGCGKVFPKRKGWLKHDLTHMAKRVCGYCGIAVRMLP
jgi:hypothetical protein